MTLSDTDWLTIDCTVERPFFDVGVRLDVEPRETVAFFGPSGAGKTTLLECIAGLVAPRSGEVRLGDAVLSRPAGGRRRRLRPSSAPGCGSPLVAVVRQRAMLFPHLDVEENLSYGDAEPELVREAIDRLELGDLRGSRPRSLSGGQAQRVALGRALSRHFSLLLLDEPMAAVDHPSRSALWAFVHERLAAEHASALLVTHDLAEAQQFGNRMVLLERGACLGVGTPQQLVQHPPSQRAASLVGYSEWLEVKRAGPRTTTGWIGFDPSRATIGHDQAAPLLLTGSCLGCRPAGTTYEITMQASDVVVAGGPDCPQWSLAAPTRVAAFVDSPADPAQPLTVSILHATPIFGDTQR
jgi:ABC-type sulfate/molybdate transport systems ATPase subunit